MTSRSTVRRLVGRARRLLAVALVVFGAGTVSRAQQGPDDDPDTNRGYVNNIFHHTNVDSINLYNGSLTIPIPLGPEYPVGPKLKYQAMLVYASKAWEFGSPNANHYPGDGLLYTPIVGDQALGIGWTFTPGAIKKCGQSEQRVCYVGPDGSEHQFDPPGTGVSGTRDASQLMLKGDDANGYDMWDGEGNHYVFSWHVHGYDDGAQDPDYNYTTDLGRGRDGWYLRTLSDPFGNTVTFSYYSNLGSLPCWDPVNMRCATSDPVNKQAWIPSLIAGPSWSITVNLDPQGGTKRIDNFSFQTAGTTTATWSLGYGSATLQRNAPEPTSSPAVTLTSISLPGASYAFGYNSGPTGNGAGNPGLEGGLINSMTLPAGALITYAWRQYAFYHARKAGLLNCTAQPPPDGLDGSIPATILVTQFLGLTTPEPEVPSPALSGCIQGQLQLDPSQYVDKVEGVVRRTESVAGNANSNTDYVQIAYPFHEQGSDRGHNCNLAPGRTGECGPQTMTIMISPPSIDGYRHATGTLFWASSDALGTTPSIGDRTGADIETRVFDFDPVTAAITFTSPTGPGCGSSQDSQFCPNHAVRVTQRVFDYDTPAANRRLATETTYMQAASISGDCSSCRYRKTAYTPASTWETNGRHYTQEVRSGDFGSGTQTRTVKTIWTPQFWRSVPSANHTVLANVYSEIDEWEGSTGSRTIQRLFDFDLANGFLKGQLTWDADANAGQRAYYACRTEELNGSSLPTGNASKELVDGLTSASPSPPVTYCASIPSPGTNGHTFGRQFTYDPTNRLLLTVKWLNGASAASWSARNYARDTHTGWITDSYDPAGVKTHYAYDTLGRVTAITPDGETATNVSYDTTTRTTVTRDTGTGLSTWQQYEYDGLGRLLREKKKIAGGATVKRFTGFDLDGHDYFHSEWVSNGTSENIAALLDTATTCKYTVYSSGVLTEGNFSAMRPSAAPGTFTDCFDPFGRPQKVVGAMHNGIQTLYRTDGSTFHSDSLESVTSYCVNGWFTGATCNGTGALNPITVTKKDVFARAVSVTEPNGDITSYSYDVTNKLTSVTQGSQQQRTFGYDAAGNLRSESTPEKGAVAYTSYGGLNNLLTETEPGTLAVTRSYDFAGRLTTVVAGTSTFVSNCYDGVSPCAGTGGTNKSGKLTRRIGYNPSASTQAAVTQDFTYSDPNGSSRLTQRSTTFSLGALTSAITESWAYNGLGLVQHYWHPRVSGASPFLVSTDYDQGLPVREYLNGIPMVKSVSYLNSGSLGSYTTGLGAGHDVTTTIAQDGSQLPRPGSIGTGGASSNWSSGAYTYDGAGSVVKTGSDLFTYDDRSRLSSAFYSGINTQYFCYDRWGNLTAKAIGSQPSCTASWTNNQVPGTGNYDGRGNMIKNGTETYTFDNLDRQVKHASGGLTWNYLYDAGSERVAKAPPSAGQWTYTLRDESNRVSTEYVGSSPAAASRDNVYLGNLLVASYANLAVGGNVQAWQYYSSDHLGSPRLVTDVSGTKLDGPRYWPYGEEAVTQAGPQRVRFASMERDTEATRYSDHARNHETGLGRFLSPDRVGGKAEDPQTWNRYVYSRNNPLKFVDEDGEEFGYPGQQAELDRVRSQQFLAGLATGQLLPAGGPEFFVGGLLAGALRSIAVSAAVEAAAVESAAAVETGSEPALSQATTFYGASNGEVVPAATPAGQSITAHAAERMANPGVGRSLMTPAEADKVLATGTRNINATNVRQGTVTFQNRSMPGNPRVVVSYEGGRIVTVIKSVPKAVAGACAKTQEACTAAPK